jgi:MFS family permease
MVPFFSDWGGLSYFQIFILQSWFMFWIFALEVPTGAVADYFGRKASITLACIMFTVATLTYASIPNFFVFMLAEFFWAMATALLSGADNALLYDTLKQMKRTKEAKKVFARYASIASLGIIIASPIGSFIADLTDLRTTMLLTSIPFFMAVLVSLTLKEPKITTRKKEKRYWKDLKTSLTYFRKHRVLKLLAYDFAFVAAISHMIFWFWQPMLQRSGVDILYFGIVGSVTNICAIVMMSNVDKLENLFGTKRFLFLSAFIPGTLFILSGLTSYLPIIIFSIILITGLKLTRGPLLQHYINPYVPSEKRATILSAVSMIQRLSTAIIYPIFGFVTDISLEYALFLTGGILLVLAFVSGVEEEMLT